MTDKELKKLKKPELLEILFYLQKEAEALKEENERLTSQLETMNTAKLSDDDIQRISDAVRMVLGDASKIIAVRAAEKPKE